VVQATRSTLSEKGNNQQDGTLKPATAKAKLDYWPKTNSE
jgi:hypothetical protein